MARRFFDGPQANIPDFRTTVSMDMNRMNSELVRMHQQFTPSSVSNMGNVESQAWARSSATTQLPQPQKSEWLEDFGQSIIQNNLPQAPQSESHIPLYRLSSSCIMI